MIKGKKAMNQIDFSVHPEWKEFIHTEFFYSVSMFFFSFSHFTLFFLLVPENTIFTEEVIIIMMMIPDHTGSIYFCYFNTHTHRQTKTLSVDSLKWNKWKKRREKRKKTMMMMMCVGASHPFIFFFFFL